MRESSAYEAAEGDTEGEGDDLVELPLDSGRDLNQALPWLRRACRFVRSNSMG